MRLVLLLAAPSMADIFIKLGASVTITLSLMSFKFTMKRKGSGLLLTL